MVDLTTIETGRRLINIMARNALSHMTANGIEISAEGFKQLVQEAKALGRNAGFLLDGSEAELGTNCDLKELEQIQEAFISGDRCQRGHVFKAMQEMASQEQLV